MNISVFRNVDLDTSYNIWNGKSAARAARARGRVSYLLYMFYFMTTLCEKECGYMKTVMKRFHETYSSQSQFTIKQVEYRSLRIGFCQ